MHLANTMMQQYARGFAFRGLHAPFVVVKSGHSLHKSPWTVHVQSLSKLGLAKLVPFNVLPLADP